MKKNTSLGSFEQVLLLAILRLKDKGAYGVSIRAEIKACTGREPAPGAIYTTLDRLEDKGLVRSSAGDPSPERGGRSKRLYQVTAQGLGALRQVQDDYRNLLQGLSISGGQHA